MRNKLNQNKITIYKDINKLLLSISNGIQNILDDCLIGLYLSGSLSYGDFNPGSSDIDLIAIVDEPLHNPALGLLKELHKEIGEHYQQWSDRLECSYTPIDMLKNILPPKEPRPYFGGGIFYEDAPYGNEWIINNYLLYKHGLPLIGPDFKELIKPIDIIEVQKACIIDLFQEWEPKIIDFEWLENSHYQSYLVLNLCRILFTVHCGMTGTKKTSAQWVKNKFGLWETLIDTAENWSYGKEMQMRRETIDFIKFAVDNIKETDLFQQMQLQS